MVAQRWEKVHIFISSTFNDMHAERDYLVKRVFPELQEWCEERKLRLVDIDLRWGVTEQDATRHKNVLKVCLSRIDDCRPFFLCFLGQRRGWVPEENESSPETFCSFPDLRRIAGTASITEIEILHALISPFHQSLERDGSRPLEYYEPTKYAFFYLRDPSYLDDLPKYPSMLREVYTNEWIEDIAKREEYDLALQIWRDQKIPDCNRSFHLYEATWNVNATTPELRIPLQCPTIEAVNVERWQKLWQKAGVHATTMNVADNPVELSKASQFNARLSEGRLTDFECEATPLSEIIIKELQQAITERYAEHIELEHDDEKHRELDQQENILFTAGELFIERSGDFAELDEYVEDASNKLFVLVGAGGIGKSTLLANWIDRYRRRIEGNTDDSVHFRFIGQSDGTTTVNSVLRSILNEIKEIAHKLNEDIPLDPIELREKWLSLLEIISKRGKTVIVLDALNQLESGLTDLRWLPRQLPRNIKLIASFKRGDSSGDQLFERFSENNHVKLSEVKPFENTEDRRRLVTVYLSQYLKELDERQLETVVSLRGAENPLYLKVVLSELRVFGAFENLSAQIRNTFGDNPVSAFHGVLHRLETDPSYTALDSATVVPLLFGFLAHARTGITTDELTDLILEQYPSHTSLPAQAVPEAMGKSHRRQEVVDVVNLSLRQARAFLARRAGRTDLLYESFKIAALERYEEEPTDQRPMNRPGPRWHQPLADMYYQQAKTVSEVFEPLFDVHLTYNVKAELEKKWVQSQIDQLTSIFAESVGQSSVSPYQLLLDLYEIFKNILAVDIYRAGRIVDELHEKGSCVVARLQEQEAEAVATTFNSQGMRARLEPASIEPPESWTSMDARICSELLFHHFEGHMWRQQIEVLTDDKFRSRCMELHGPKFFVDGFEELLRRLSEDADAHSFLAQLRLRLPIDSEFYTPFLKQLAEGWERDPEQAMSFLADCAQDRLHHGRSEIALRAFSVAGAIKLNCRRGEVQAQLEKVVNTLLASHEKKTRWETVRAYWSLLPRGEVGPLIRVAESETEHPIVRAEAARQLGFVDDPQLVSILLRLARSDLYPLKRMAYRSARLIQLSQRLIEIGPVEDVSQADELPASLAPVLTAIGVDPKNLDLGSVSDQTRILIHIAGCSELSVDTRWEEFNLIENILRLLPCRLICCEAGVGDNSLDYLKEYSNSEYRLSTTGRYFHDLLLSSVEYLQLITDYKFSIQGVDIPEQYALGIIDKYGQTGQGVGLKIAASVDRAKAMLDSTLGLIRDLNSRVCILKTSELPGYQISRILGEERQFMRQMAQETQDTGDAVDSLILGEDNSLLESLLPETVPSHLVGKPDNLFYIMLRMAGPQGQIFGMDINYIHSLGILRGTDLLQKLQKPPTATAAKVLWRPQDFDFQEKDLRCLDFSRQSMEGRDFSHATLSRSTFASANLTGAVFENANLRGVDLSNSIMASTFCRGASFFQAQLLEADANHADFQGANFYEACLNNANLTGSLLDNATLYAAALHGANLTNANLRGSDLRRANLSGANLTNADLGGARLELTLYDEKTLWPKDFAVDDHRFSNAILMVERHRRGVMVR